MSDQPLQVYVDYWTALSGPWDEGWYQYANAVPGRLFVVPLSDDHGEIYILATENDTEIRINGSTNASLNIGQSYTIPAVAGETIATNKPVAVAFISNNRSNRDSTGAVSLIPISTYGTTFWTPRNIDLHGIIRSDNRRLVITYENGDIETRPMPSTPSRMITERPASVYWVFDVLMDDPASSSDRRRLGMLALTSQNRLPNEYINASYIVSTADGNVVEIDEDYDGLFDKQVILNSGEMYPSAYQREGGRHQYFIPVYLGHVRASNPLFAWQIGLGAWNGVDEQVGMTEQRGLSLEFPSPTPTPRPNQPTPTPKPPTPTATPDFPDCRLTIDKQAFPSVVRIDEQVGVTLKLEGECDSEVGAAIDVALVIDRSNSMCGSKLGQAQAAGEVFLQSMAFPPDQASVISFASTALLHSGLTGNRTTATNALYNITCGGFSRIDAGLIKAFEEMSNSRRVAGHTPAVILLTDGKPEGVYADDVRAAAKKLRDANIQVYAIGLGNDVNAPLLREIASQPDFYYQSPSPDQLAQIYTRLAGQLRNVPAANIDITDIIGANFELVPNSFSGAASPQVYGNSLLWHFPGLDSGQTEVNFRIKPKACGTFPANQSASVSFDDNRGNRRTLTFPVPTVTVQCENLTDVFVRDNDRDNGLVPSGEPWWLSPDLWVRNNDDGGAVHQNPIGGQRNYIYARVWNRGSTTVQNIDVNLYFAQTSLGLVWPDDWNELSPSRTIASLAPGQSAVVSIPWDTPNLAGHFCLFVRINAPGDPLRVNNVEWENNLAMHNLHILEYPQPQAGACNLDDNGLQTDRVAFDVANTLGNSTLVDLTITVSNLGSDAEVRFEPGPLTGRWASLDGLEPEPDGRLLVTSFPARLYGIRMNPGEQRTVHVEVKAPGNSRFTIGLTEYIRGKVVGGNTYQRYLPPCPLALPLILQTSQSLPTPTPTATPCPTDDYTPPDVILALDRSGSMEGEKLAAAKNAVSIFLNEMDLTQEQAGIVSFAGDARLDQILTLNIASLNLALSQVSAGSDTAIGEGIALAQEELQSGRHVPDHTSVIVLLSDGQNTVGQDPLAAASAAKAAGTRIVTIGLGDDADHSLLRQIASQAGDYYFAPSPHDLVDIYRSIAGKISCYP
ncbi:MAG: VWA domain-containing protein [Caldilineales bacterium]|nr:VWA domain-containing protein [Caldilineales bacterium]